jgi:cobalamin biosynthesis Mg chelatase CobN
MSQLSIKLSDKADALIAQLQKEIFNRRRKKVTAAGVVETLVESGARSQSDKRFATSWLNLIEDIEKAAKLATAHGSKPAALTDEEWVMVLSYRNRQVSKPRQATKTSKAVKADKPAAATRTTTATKTKRVSSSARVAKARVAKTTETSTTSVASVGKPRKARRARKSSPESTSVRSTAGRMAKAAAQLASSNGIQSPARS